MSDDSIPPILRIPVEITAKIFTHCVPDPASVNPGAAPLLLTQICADWRAIAHSTPTLWNNLHIEVSPSPTPRTHPAAVSAYLARSAACPLQISVDARGAFPSGLAAAVIAHAARWRRLRLHIRRADMAALLCVQGPFPMLTSVNIDVYERGRGEPWTADIPLLRAPGLRFAYLSVDFGGYLSLAGGRIGAAVEGLDYTVGEDVQGELRVIFGLRRLRRLRLGAWNTLPDGVRPMDSSSLGTCRWKTTLQTLELHDAAWLPSALVLPSLTALTVKRVSTWAGAAEQLPTLQKFLSTNGSRLTELVLSIDGGESRCLL
ncbi:NAD(P)-binding protein [Mycena kentingensis (nom. inval.)]|nr:NAD(P)-binding protein [Mycena kentingensis (nom. inval.)]